MSGHDPLEAAMFWVGALLAFLPVLVLTGVLLYVRWQKKKARGVAAPPIPPATQETDRT